MADDADPLVRTLAIVGVSLLVALALTVVFAAFIDRPIGDHPRFALLLGLKLLVTTFNVVVLLVLVGVYASIYRDLPNNFTASLILFSVALLLYALSSNPLVHLLFGFRGGLDLGLFAVLPDVFAAVAIVVLLYQSHK